MAQLLIRAAEHWMDKLTNQEVQAMSDKDFCFLDSYNSRYKKGDVVAIREDNQGIGIKECLPDFLVIKVDGKKADLMYLIESRWKDVLRFDEIKMESYTEEALKLKRVYNFDIDENVTTERLAEIESNNWLVDEYLIEKVVDKTK